MRRFHLLCVLAVAATLAGCTDPYQNELERTTHERRPKPAAPAPQPAPPPPAPTRGLGPTPEAALRAFAKLYTNWTARTVARQLTKLARAATGEAAQEMARAAQETRSDYELHGGGVFNRGTVEAVVRQHSRSGHYLVVTLERTGATSKDYEGLRPAYHVTLADVVQLADGSWTVRAWRPQS